MEYIAKGIANTEYTKSLDVAVQRVKNDEEWRHDYMTLYMRDRENQKIGKEIGKKIGKKIGELAKTISLIRRNKNKYDEDMLSSLCNLSKTEYQNIIFYINNYPELNDEKIAEKLLKDKEKK